MNLTPLGEMQFKYTWLQFIDYGSDGQSLGTLDGELRGDRLSGSLKVVNTPPRRSDNINCPTIKGVLTTADGATVYLEMNGLSLLRAADQARVFTTSLTLRTSDQRYKWVNNIFGMVEGVLNTQTDSVQARAYLCENTFGT
jgi:hypothetical protein